MPARAYVELADMKAWLAEAGVERDSEIQRAIEVASQMVERWCGRDFASDTVTEQLIGNGAFYIFPARTPITAVSSVTIDGQAIPFRFDIMGIKRTDGGRFGIHDTVVVTYTGGYDVIPDDVVHATKITAQAVLGAPATDPNLAYENAAGFGAFSYAPQGPGALPRAAMTLLEGVRRRH